MTVVATVTMMMNAAIIVIVIAIVPAHPTAARKNSSRPRVVVVHVFVSSMLIANVNVIAEVTGIAFASQSAIVDATARVKTCVKGISITKNLEDAMIKKKKRFNATLTLMTMTFEDVTARNIKILEIAI